MLEIILNPNPILRKKSKPLLQDEIASEEMQKLIPEMIETMIKKDGVGLAAPQIGKNIRFITIRHKDGNLAMFNPRIISKSLAKEMGEEGCLSLPNLFGNVKRNKKITAIYTDGNGRKSKISAEGMLARVIQHEIDHLDGILFIDKAKNIVEMKPDK